MEPERYPISVRLVGVMHNDKSKLYVTSVLWSDQSDIVVYRSFGEFKKMHRQMKKAFPPASKLKKSDRIIPRFQDNKMRQKSRRMGPNKAVVRLKFLQKYCNELLSCGPRVSQSAHLIQFFRPKDQDLRPEFSKNSIMVMPPEDDMRSDVGPGGGNVTQPFVTETYRCVAPYETKDTKNKAFKVGLDEKVDVLIKDQAGWWLVENEAKQMAWFPAPYLERLDNGDDEDEIDGSSDRGELYTAVRTYKATKGDEITVTIGATVEVLQKSDNGWWLIRYGGKAGYIPTMYLQPYRRPHIHMLSPPGLEQHSQLSRSHGNLLQLPPTRSSTPLSIQSDSRHKSRSLSVLNEPPPAPVSTIRAAANPGAASASYAPPPTITVEMEGEERPRSLSAASRGSFESDSTDFSLSDDLSSSSASSTFNLSPSSNAEQLRLSRTPPPMPRNRLSLINTAEGKLIASVSDPNLYRGPAMPKVPPRPQAQEILKRCTTVTRKNAAKGGPSPTQAEIISR
ncbi:NADPH oxidase organizer 1a [Stegastes partitus]|uniref:NADPH oxidase organizer 1 n=1 Tax=Stegastes partitus TaxID=144197 RepID=A0A3B5AKX4_9TELE|nr:PREDICTED: NADPH oxidase organizer 1 [Stegastes partitus]